MKKRILFFNKNIYFILIVVLYFSCSSYKKAINSKSSEYDSKMLKACELYVENYQPLYYLNGDTLEIGVFNSVPDSINNYLLKCAINNDFKALKYSYAIVLRQSKEIEKITTTPLVEHFIVFQPNGFIELFVKAMGVPKYEYTENEVNEGMIYSEPLFFADLCEWAEKNKKIIIDFDYIKKYKKNLNKK
jgi:hypothetical protein